jgi:UDP-hydrolysing UDP-N-acetyl-D-glucosamine 2-epimerase
MVKRKTCVVVNGRANYGRIKSLLTSVQDSTDLELQLVVGASALLYRFGNVRELMESEGFTPSATVYSVVEGETPTTMAKSTGLAIIELATLFENLKPDAVVTVADRFDTMATAIAASYMNIPLAHTQGGEVTGSIDESVRHAVTKLAHIHFPATELAAKNIIRMGEEPERVFLTGCPSIDAIANIDLAIDDNFFTSNLGVGPLLDARKPYLVVVQHPVTTEYGKGFAQINETLQAVEKMQMQTVWLWPNVDAGSDDISKGLRMYRESNSPDWLHLYRNFTVEDYARLMQNCSCILGNSSSALREGAFLGTPAVNIGSRQTGRERGDNVIDAEHAADDIAAKIGQQIAHGKYPRSTRFGNGGAGARIAEILASTEFAVQKRLTYDQEGCAD